MKPKRTGALTCSECKALINSNTARVQREGRWLCPDCAYTAAHLDAPRVTRHRKPRTPQSETLL